MEVFPHGCIRFALNSPTLSSLPFLGGLTGCEIGGYECVYFQKFSDFYSFQVKIVAVFPYEVGFERRTTMHCALSRFRTSESHQLSFNFRRLADWIGDTLIDYSSPFKADYEANYYRVFSIVPNMELSIFHMRLIGCLTWPTSILNLTIVLCCFLRCSKLHTRSQNWWFVIAEYLYKFKLKFRNR